MHRYHNFETFLTKIGANTNVGFERSILITTKCRDESKTRLIATTYRDLGGKLEIVYLERQNVALSITKLKNDLCRCKFAHLEYQKFVFWPD